MQLSVNRWSSWPSTQPIYFRNDSNPNSPAVPAGIKKAKKQESAKAKWKTRAVSAQESDSDASNSPGP